MESAAKQQAPKRTVLIIEDNVMNREILTELLSDSFDVIEAENGMIGLETLHQHQRDISVILLDVYMPICNGFEFLEERLKHPYLSAIPVIVMTASSSVEDEIRCLQLGAADFITKPFMPEVMKNRIQSIIRLSESSAMLDKLEKDHLTDLYSKEFFSHNASKILSESPNEMFDLLCSDIEHFRTLNDRYGQKRCDELLCDLAKKLSAAIPHVIAGGRIDADVFAFLMKHHEQDWTGRLKDILGSDYPVNASIKYGIMQNVPHDMPVPTMCERAQMALNRVKGKYSVDVGWYDENLRQAMLKEQRMVDEMASALRSHQFQVYFQPKHDIQNNCVSGAEALVRWIHPQLGFVSPGEFIPLFEKNGFLTQLDPYVWEECCREIRRCQQNGIPVVPVSINVSRMLFDVPDLVENLIDLVNSYGVDPSLLHIELTESACAEKAEHIVETLKKMHDSGFRIELDDFGSGYSTLTSLRTLTLDVMKLDMSLIRYAAKNNDYSLIRYSILLAECLKLQTVAEGIETKEQLDAMKVLGCDYVQGYYYSRPLPREEFETYLKSNMPAALPR